MPLADLLVTCSCLLIALAFLPKVKPVLILGNCLCVAVIAEVVLYALSVM